MTARTFDLGEARKQATVEEAEQRVADAGREAANAREFFDGLMRKMLGLDPESTDRALRWRDEKEPEDD